jgi:hypothetical protein
MVKPFQVGVNFANPWGWAGTWGEFCKLEMPEFLRSLLWHLQNRWLNHNVDPIHVQSWKREFFLFQRLVSGFLDKPSAEKSLIVFEYEMLFEDGNRPDIVLVLPTGHLIIIECKSYGKVHLDDLRQVCNYARDFTNYHNKSQQLKIVSVLCLMADGKPSSIDLRFPDVTIMHSFQERLPGLDRLLKRFFVTSDNSLTNPSEWLRGEFKPSQRLKHVFGKRLRACFKNWKFMLTRAA